MKIFQTLIIALTVLFSQCLFAAGFQINEHSVSGLGRSYAGESAMIDNAGIVARNPAAMTYFDKQSLSIVGHYISPDIDVKGTNAVPGTPLSENADAADVVPSAFVPGLFYVHPVDDKLAYGVAVTTHFGLSSEFPEGYSASEHADETSLRAIYLTPSVSYKVNEKVSLGFGLSYIQGDGTLKTSASNVSSAAVNSSFGFAVMAPGDTLLDLESDGHGYGWNLGLMWHIDDASRLGLRYMAASDVDTDASYRIFSPALVASTGGAEKYENKKGTLTLNVPEVIGLAYSRQLDEQWMIAASIQQTGWRSFEEIKVDDRVLKQEDWEDANRYALGADYQLNNSTILRAGLALDKSPVPDDKRTLSIPDSDRKVISFGSTFDYQDSGSIDLGLAYIKADAEEFTEQSSSGTSFEGELSSSDALLYSVAYNYQF